MAGGSPRATPPKVLYAAGSVPGGSAEEASPASGPDQGRLGDQLLAFAKDLNELYSRERARTRELQAALSELEESYLATVRTLAYVIEAKDPYTRSHLDRSHRYAMVLAARVSPEVLKDPSVQYGFLLHDVGKVGIPERILGKPGPLTREEWEVMRTHPLIGGRIVAPIKFLARAVPIIEAHHERWDGKGYPRGLAREEIPLGARIFMVADAFDAMTSDRPYRRALTIDAAVEEIRARSGSQFDPHVAEVFLALVAERKPERDQPWDLADVAADEASPA